MKYIIFDDHKKDNFYPLTLARSIGDLRVGVLKLRQRIAAYLNEDDYEIIVDGSLQEFYRDMHPEKVINIYPAGENIFINSRLKINEDWVAKIKALEAETMYCHNGTVLAARSNLKQEEASLTDINSNILLSMFTGLQKIEVDDCGCWEYLWEMIACNREYIAKDFEDFFYEADNQYEVEPGVTVLNPYNIWIGKDTEIKPGVVIDASQGPVIIDEEVRIMSNSVIVGPVYIGKKSLIKALARIYEGTSIGPVCKIGGEVEGTIFQGYTNKQHDGFLGHSFLGEWINLGANTNNSDLKNNYKNVSAYFYPSQEKIDTGSMFVGTMIGDHTKTAISTTINTGTVIGAACNLIGCEVFKGNIPSFSWGQADSLRKYDFEKFVETCKSVKRRRKLQFSDSERALYKSLYSSLCANTAGS